MHYNYEGNIDLKEKESPQELPQVPIKINIHGIKFMVPVQIDFEVVNALTEEVISDRSKINGDINMAQQELTLDLSVPKQIQEEIKKSVFHYLLNEMMPPEDQFQAGEEVYEQAERASAEHGNLHNQNVGE